MMVDLLDLTKKYIGIPWFPDGRTHDGADCWGVTRLVFKEELGIELPDAPFASTLSYDDKWSLVYDCAALNGWRKIPEGEEIEPFDIVVYKVFGNFHMAMMLGKNDCLTSDALNGVVTQPFDRERRGWSRGRTDLAFYRYAGREDTKSADMSRINFIVTSTPRSGTQYIADLLSAIGIHCGHEKAFSMAPGSAMIQPYEFWGDSSFYVVPRLSTLSSEIPILHQTREPEKTIASLAWILGGRDDETLSAMSRKVLGMAVGYFEKVCPEIATRDANTTEKACAVWVRWNTMIEDAKRRNYMRYRVEDIDVTLVQRILEFIGFYSVCTRTTSERDIGNAIENTSRTTNGHNDVATLLGASHRPKLDRVELTTEARNLAIRYGYDA